MAAAAAAAPSGGSDVDRISGLPDDILHKILVGLPDTAAAARTSVLSRRWPRVWAHVPELRLLYHDDPSARTQGRVDAALSAYAAPSIDRLLIDLAKEKRKVDLLLIHPRRDGACLPRVPGHRISAWLLFASQHLTESLHLATPFWADSNIDDEDEHQVLLPLSEKIKEITLSLSYHMLRLQLPISGECTTLVSLTIEYTEMDSHELEDAVSSLRCPCLKVLKLVSVDLHGAHPGFSIQSDSLQHLYLKLRDKPEFNLVQVSAPKLQTLYIYFFVDDAFISAPMLSEVQWYAKYNPSRHLITEAGSYLHKLEIMSRPDCDEMELMQRFRTVHELILKIAMSSGVQGYQRFMSGISKLCRCEILVVDIFAGTRHDLKTTLLSLLRKSAGVKKFVLKVQMDHNVCLTSECPCHFPENSKIDDIVLGSLEEVEVHPYLGGGDDQKIELVKLLYQLSETSHKNVTITLSQRYASANMREKISSACPPNNKVEIRM